MKIYRLLSEKVKQLKQVIIFDMDGTLYTHDEYLRSQFDLPIKRLAKLQKKTFNQMKREISEYRKMWAEEHGGKSVSLGNIFLSFGISIEKTISWREELYRPEDYLSEDKLLRSSLEKLVKHFTLAVITNNPVSIAVRTLNVLGVQDLFHTIAGLDTCMVSKPNEVIFKKVLQDCCVNAQQCISIGDRFDIDIALALKLNMGGILVEEIGDIYELPDLLLTDSVLTSDNKKR